MVPDMRASVFKTDSDYSPIVGAMDEFGNPLVKFVELAVNMAPWLSI